MEELAYAREKENLKKSRFISLFSYFPRNSCLKPCITENKLTGANFV
jgi:hypothetical protein